MPILLQRRARYLANSLNSAAVATLLLSSAMTASAATLADASPLTISPSSSQTGFTSNLPLNLDQEPVVGNSSVSSSKAIAPPTQTFDGEAEPVLEAQIDVSTQLATNVTGGTQDDDKMAMRKSDSWTQILAQYAVLQDDGLVRFDYAGLKASQTDMAALQTYIEDLSNQEPSTFNRAEGMVYWANLYNALTVQIVAQNYPVKSIRKIKSGFLPGPWKKKLVEVEGKNLSLDNIEHDILRPTYKTPLVHYMVNCASIGCPNLQTKPWSAKTLDEDLDIAARAFINSPRGAMIDDGKLKVSSIYKWFDKDFGGNQQGVLAHLETYADEDLAEVLGTRNKIDKFDYDWGINAP